MFTRVCASPGHILMMRHLVLSNNFWPTPKKALRCELPLRTLDLSLPLTRPDAVRLVP